MKTSIKIKNLTHYAQITKHLPNSNIPNLINKVQEAQKDYAKSLDLDNTKTRTEKERLYAQSGARLTKPLIDRIQESIDSVQKTITAYHSKVDAELKIKGTTDVVILNSYAQASEGASASKLMTLARENVDIARAVLLSPFMIVTLNLNDEKKAYFHDQVTRHMLGEDYEKLTLAKEQSEVLHSAGQGILDSHVAFVTELSRIGSTVASMPEAGELLV